MTKKNHQKLMDEMKYFHRIFEEIRGDFVESGKK